MSLIRHVLKNVYLEYGDQCVMIDKLTFTAEMIIELCSCEQLDCPCSCVIFKTTSIQFSFTECEDQELLKEVVNAHVVSWVSDQPMDVLSDLEICDE